MDRIIIQFGRSKIILALIIGMGLVFGYLNYSPADDSIPSLLVNEPTIRDDNLDFLSRFKLDLSILDDKRYKDLEILGENPVDPGIIGERKNPFAPLF